MIYPFNPQFFLQNLYLGVGISLPPYMVVIRFCMTMIFGELFDSYPHGGSVIHSFNGFIHIFGENNEIKDGFLTPYLWKV
jgi:hypothetical protein